MHTEEHDIVTAGADEVEEDDEIFKNWQNLVAQQNAEFDEKLREIGMNLGNLKYEDADEEDKSKQVDEEDASLCLDMSSIKKGQTRRDRDDDCEDELAMFEAGVDSYDDGQLVAGGLDLGEQAFDKFRVGDDIKNRVSTESGGSPEYGAMKKKSNVNIFG